MIDCPVCGNKIPRDDLEIQRHFFDHEDEWINRGRE